MKGKCRFFVALLLIFCMMTTVTAAESDTAEITETEQKDEARAEEVNPNPKPQFQVNAKSAALIEAETGNTVFAMNENEKLPIASITKIMTMLLAMEAVDNGKLSMKDTVTISANACSMGGSQVYLEEGEIFTVEELMKAIAVHSANDASVALAEKVSGSEEAFVHVMNERAKELKMSDTNFLDATGLTDEGHYSTAHDIAIMARELLTKHPKIIYYTTIWHDSFRDGKFDLDNTNKLVKRYSGITGLKTGFTSKAGFCLAASAERDGTKLISVVLGSESNEMRFSESAKLLDFGFANWETARIEKKGLPAGSIMVKKGEISEIPLVYGENAVILVKKGNKNQLTENAVIPENINAPVNIGQVVGVLNVELDGNRLASIPITAAGESRKCSFGLMLGMLAKRWAGLFCSCPEEPASQENIEPDTSPAPDNTSPSDGNPGPGNNPVTDEDSVFGEDGLDQEGASIEDEPEAGEGALSEEGPEAGEGALSEEGSEAGEGALSDEESVIEEDSAMEETPTLEDSSGQEDPVSEESSLTE